MWKTNYKLETCIDHEHQFERAKRPQAPGDATSETVFPQKQRITFLESVNFSTCAYMQLFNFCDGHVTTFRHPSGAYVSQMQGHRFSRLAKGIPSESWLSIGTTGLE